MEFSQAVQELSARMQAGDRGALSPSDWMFATGLLKTVSTQKRPPSDKQVHWLVKMAQAANEPPPEQKVVHVGSMQGLIEMFNKAAEHLKYPKVVLMCGTSELTLYRAGSKAKVPGSVTVLQGDDWLGRVLTDGNMETRKAGLPDPVLKILQEMSKNPAKVASEHGKLTGKCCFCNSKLTTKESTGVGYGPVCAKRYGLLWGKVQEEVL